MEVLTLHQCQPVVSIPQPFPHATAQELLPHTLGAAHLQSPPYQVRPSFPAPSLSAFGSAQPGCFPLAFASLQPSHSGGPARSPHGGRSSVGVWDPCVEAGIVEDTRLGEDRDKVRGRGQWWALFAQRGLREKSSQSLFGEPSCVGHSLHFGFFPFLWLCPEPHPQTSRGGKSEGYCAWESRTDASRPCDLEVTLCLSFLIVLWGFNEGPPQNLVSL